MHMNLEVSPTKRRKDTTVTHMNAIIVFFIDMILGVVGAQRRRRLLLAFSFFIRPYTISGNFPIAALNFAVTLVRKLTKFLLNILLVYVGESVYVGALGAHCFG